MASARNLKVSGTINETDLTFIGQMIDNYKLRGKLDLENAVIQEGMLSGEMFHTKENNSYPYTPYHTIECFSVPKHLSLDQLDNCCRAFNMDTLIAGGENQADFKLFKYRDSQGIQNPYFRAYIGNWSLKHLELREGTVSININGNVEKQNQSLKSIHLPSTMKIIAAITWFLELERINVPENVELLGSLKNTIIKWDCDTLFVPASVKQFETNWICNEDFKALDGNSGKLSCIFFPEKLEHFSVQESFQNYKVDFHFKSSLGAKITGNDNCHLSIDDWGHVFVPEGYMGLYSYDGKMYEEVLPKKIESDVPTILYKNDTYHFNVNFTPDNTTFKDTYWTWGEDGVVSFSSPGVCIAQKCGETQITVRNADKSCYDTRIVHVYEHTTGVALETDNVTLNIGEFIKIGAHTLPLNTSDNRITWISSNSRVATVNVDGGIDAVGKGTCVITATSVDGNYQAQCVVTVTQPIETVSLDKHALSLNVGASEQLFANVAPNTANNKKLLWNSVDSGVASVDANGVVTGLKPGSTFIKVISEDNPNAMDSCKVTVFQPVTGITLDKSSIEFRHIGETAQIVATIIPDDASNQEIIWTNSQQSVCYMSNGTVVAVGYGTSVVIATTVDGGHIAVCIVKVLAPGDINADGQVDVADMNIMIDMVLGKQEQDLDAADLNNDGMVDVTDVNKLIDIVLGKN